MGLLMDPARRAQIERLYRAARERTVEERKQFIVAACAGDAELRRQLESLLAQDLAGNGALDRPAWEGASTLPGEANGGRLEPGAEVGPYRIESHIGGGGMGDVYKARDPRLGRLVAIKMLRSGVEDSAGRQRFLREARAASALNHPNIVTIHDVITQSGADYLVMEHVSGKTLDRVIPRRGLRAGELLHYAVQTSGALAAAHAAGIVHRDIKPSNVMVTDEGGVKVLDFGLAKLLEQDPAPADSTCTASLRTEEGIVLGSIPYMSPEQAEGKPVDARTDVFSFGAVLYEMCTGQRAFQGDSKASILAAVIAKEPPPIGQFAPDTPRELERTILRCLRKDRSRRFQTMLDLKLTLEELKSESDSGRLTPSPHLVPQVGSRRRIQAIIAATAVALAFAGGWTWWRFNREPPYRPLPFAQLTYDGGLSTDPAVSLDGQLIAWASDRAGEGNLDIWVQYRGGAPVRVTHNQADEYEPSFSPDGTQIVYRSDQDGGGIYVVSSLGGAEPRLVASGGSRPRFSPDGSEILVDDVGGQIPRIVNVAAPAAAPRQLAPEFATVQTPVWSPGGEYLLIVGRKSVDKLIPSVFILPRNGGAAELVRFQLQSAWLETTAMAIDAWLPGDRVLGELEIRGSTHLWLARLRRNPWRLSGLEQITFGTGSVMNASVSRDGTIVASSEEMDLDLWSIPIDANQGKVLGEPRRLTHDAAREQYPSISLDGSRLVYSSEQMAASHIWLMELPSGLRRMLTSSSEFDFRPVISSNGRQIAYISANRALFVISPEMAVSNWVMATSGGPAQKLKTGSAVIWDWSDDARALTAWTYRLPRSVGVEIIDLATGEAKPLLTRPRNLFQAHISHDGHWVMVQESGGGVLMAPIMDAQPPAADLWQPIGLKGADLIRWSPDDNLIYFISKRDSFRCIWAQRVDQHTKRPVGEPFAIAHFHQARRSLRIPDSGKIGLAIARNQIVFAEAERTGNIWTANLGR